jgi:tripartite-type tricarboxylate transporter receptor subunit TctC
MKWSSKAVVMMCLLIAVPLGCHAQSYPARPVRLVAPFPPGGATDVLARLVAEKLANGLHQSVVVDNRPGAGGNIGADIVAKASADGYTLLMGSTALAINVSLYKKLSYDFSKDLAPVAQVAIVPNVLVVNPSIPAHSMAELISVAHARQNLLNFGSSGNGSVGHLSAALLTLIAGIDVAHIPYKGSTPVITDLTTGQVDLAVESVVATLPQIRAGKLRPLGVTSAKRTALLPDVPTMEEQGLRGFVSSGWAGVFAPAGTPVDIIERLNAEIVKALQSAEVKQRMEGLGAEQASGTPTQFADFLKEDVARWTRLVKASKATVD